ncbi:MAG: radical SAM protein, partial [Alphaproteobacteria bacterium]
SLGTLVQRILQQVPALPRLRLSSIDSIEVDDALIEAITGDSRVMPYLHLSLQSGDNMVLKRMKRRHLREEAIAFCETVRAKRPAVTFGADIIAGFPTETEEMFENSLKLVDDCGLTFLHVFPYSPREGTPAARMPQLDRAIIKDRARRLRAEGTRALSQHLAAQQGREICGLVERAGRARAEDFTELHIPTDLAPGTVHKLRVTGQAGDHLIAIPV